VPVPAIGSRELLMMAARAPFCSGCTKVRNSFNVGFLRNNNNKKKIDYRRSDMSYKRARRLKIKQISNSIERRFLSRFHLPKKKKKEKHFTPHFLRFPNFSPVRAHTHTQTPVECLYIYFRLSRDSCARKRTVVPLFANVEKGKTQNLSKGRESRYQLSSINAAHTKERERDYGLCVYALAITPRGAFSSSST